MDDLRALQRAVQLNATDPTPRRVLADYLGDQGHDLASRFIHAQLDIAELPRRHVVRERAVMERHGPDYYSVSAGCESNYGMLLNAMPGERVDMLRADKSLRHGKFNRMLGLRVVKHIEETGDVILCRDKDSGPWEYEHLRLIEGAYFDNPQRPDLWELNGWGWPAHDGGFRNNIRLPLGEMRSMYFNRGFVETVRITLSQFHHTAFELFAQQPIQRIVLHDRFPMIGIWLCTNLMESFDRRNVLPEYFREPLLRCKLHNSFTGDDVIAYNDNDIAKKALELASLAIGRQLASLETQDACASN